MLRVINISNPDTRPFFYVDKNSEAHAAHLLDKLGIEKNDLVIGLQPGSFAEMQWKRWSAEKYAQLADRLIHAYGAKILLFGSPSEKKLVEEVKRMMRREPFIMAGTTTIKQAAALLQICNFLVCNDSGLMHVSAAVGTPVFAIYGPTDYVRTAPYGEGNTLIRNNIACSPCFRIEGSEIVENCPHHKCLNDISVDMVFQIIADKM